MVNYANGKIYKIQPKQGGDIYIGSTTTKYLASRLAEHRSSYKRWKDGKTHYFSVFDIFDKYGVNECVIILLELVSSTCEDELLKRERHYFEETDCVNKMIPFRSIDEKKEMIHESNRSVERKEQSRQNYIKHSNNKRAGSKAYYNSHQAECVAKAKQYRLENAEIIKERKKGKI